MSFEHLWTKGNETKGRKKSFMVAISTTMNESFLLIFSDSSMHSICKNGEIFNKGFSNIFPLCIIPFIDSFISLGNLEKDIKNDDER